MFMSQQSHLMATYLEFYRNHTHPAYKLLRCSFAENSNSVTTKEDLVLISDTLQYLVAASSNKEMEKHMVSEASLIVCNTICDIQDCISQVWVWCLDIPKDDETYDRFLSLLIRLLNERREDNSVSFSILVYLQRLSSDGSLRLMFAYV